MCMCACNTHPLASINRTVQCAGRKAQNNGTVICGWNSSFCVAHIRPVRLVRSSRDVMTVSLEEVFFYYRRTVHVTPRRLSSCLFVRLTAPRGLCSRRKTSRSCNHFVSFLLPCHMNWSTSAVRQVLATVVIIPRGDNVAI